MYLKSIEIQGFKSFADKVELQFGQGITVVVGPNGSGKSNLVDAVRWVLGEQSSRSLRGGKMEDLIFAGSKTRRAMGMAQVNLVLDNSQGIFPLDFHEVAITRRIFRSGESDYLINKVPSRLKDIQELIMDTGVGKEGFSIIGQGKIDEILNFKPEERRTFIEEAAGIVKYRHRKKEAVKKLEDTELNLARIHDIVTELKQQVIPLGEQAAKARSYRRYKEELDNWEISFLLYDLEAATRKKLETEEQIRRLNDDLIVAQKNYLTVTADIEQCKGKLTARNEEVSASQQELHNRLSLIQRIEGEIKLAEERLQTARLQQQSLTDEGTKERAVLSELKGQFQACLAGDDKLAVQLEEQNRQLFVKQRDLEQIVSGRTALEEKIAELKKIIFDLINKRAELNTQRAEANAGINQGRERLAFLRKQLTKGETEVKQLENIRQEKERRQVKLAGQIHKITAELHTLESQRQSLEKELANITDGLSRLQNRKQSLSSRGELLSEMINNYEGYALGVKAVLQGQAKGYCQGIKGVVAELLTVEPQYETAIEVALGGSLQHLVTENSDRAKQAIEYLKKLGKGRATFLPLDNLRLPKRPDGFNLSAPGIIGFASELVRCQVELQPVAEFLLGKILVVANLDTALKLSRQVKGQLRIVTLDGDVFNVGGSITGGSYQKQGGHLLGRKRELNEIKQLLLEIDQEITAQENLARQVRDDLEDCRGKIQRKQQTIHQLQVEFHSVQKEVENMQSQIKQGQEVNSFHAGELARIEKQLHDSIALNERIAVEIGELEQERTGLEAKLAEDLKELESYQDRENELTREVNELQLQLALVSQQVKSGLKERERLEGQIKLKEKEIMEKEQGAAALSDRISSLELEREELQEQMKQGVNEQRIWSEKLALAKQQREAELKMLEEKERQADQARVVLNELQKDLQSWEIKKVRLDGEESVLLNKLAEDFNLTVEEAYPLKKTIGNKKEGQQRMTELKKLIDDLGEINFQAEQDYARVQERLNFLQQNLADLETAKSSLYQVINEMDRILTHRFKEAFFSISSNFTEVFQELFGGGRGELFLTDENDLLNTGVDIRVQPPGKKMQPLAVLSGGERALTAIALLFAALKVRPSIFYLLDEIDAALDEANVEKFAAFLRSFANHAQFIVISHRKATMEQADRLYGITTEEAGVSKILSLRLREAKFQAS